MKWSAGRSPYFLTVSSKAWNTVVAGQDPGPSVSMRMSTSPSARVVVHFLVVAMVLCGACVCEKRAVMSCVNLASSVGSGT